ncbi:fimbria/pilus outer membrane usher protein [Vibrio aestuarianus]|uniref:fimbria/pilus outer membrane usher protein n=1 Tax=Vibrio aestuarianus TaxID=28171 RepID=UPI00237C54BD|nr:fimbria/pilus outer membrane usher protein [Vibrio aestuarianus]MDE1338716.1 fimbria/pilus outer membrane usher protein [Vibrio aestuarianus]
MKTARGGIYWLILFGLCSQIVWAQAKVVKLNPTGRDIELVSLLKVSDGVIGEAQITITADDDILLPKASTLALLATLVSEQAINTLSEASRGDMLSQQDFRAAGLDLNFDFSSLECVIIVPPEQLLTQQLSLSSSQINASKLSPAFVSGYLNISLSGMQSQAVDNDDSQRETLYSHRFDAALNIGPANIEYESTYEHASDESAIYARQGTRLNVDFPSQGTRLVIGDMFNAGKNLQDSVDILGVGITRDFTLIPTRNVRPKATQSFTLLRTSNVDVVIDGVIVQRLTLSAGSYNLNDIPLAQGNNDIELIITDSTGKQERVQFSVATGNDLLNSGEFEYSLVAGVPSEFDDKQLDYETSQHVVHGYFDAGVTPWLTLGVNAQSRDKLYQYGGSLLFASPIGVTEFIASTSHHPDVGNGHAFRVAFDAEFDDSHSLNAQWSIIYDYQTDNFVGIRDLEITNTPVNSVEHYVSMFGSLDMTPRLRGAMSATYSSGSDQDDNYWSVSPSLSGPLFGTPATWSARVDYRDYQYSDDEVNTSLTLSWPLSQATRIVGRYDSSQDKTTADITYRKGEGNTGGVQAYATLVNERDSDANLDAGVNYTANRFEVIADHTTRYQDFNQDQRTHNTRLEVSSAIAFAGTSVAVGRRVGEAFAVIKKHSSLAENKVAIDPERNSEYARVYGQSKRNFLVSDLVAYNSQLVGYDVEDLPPGYDLGDGAFLLNPGYNQGYQLQIGSDAVLTVMGNLIDRQTNQPISLIAGVAHYLGDAEQEPIEFFTNRKGRFAVSGMRPGTYLLELNMKQKQSLEITIEEGSDVLILLGDLYVD